MSNTITDLLHHIITAADLIYHIIYHLISISNVNDKYQHPISIVDSDILDVTEDDIKNIVNVTSNTNI